MINELKEQLGRMIDKSQKRKRIRTLPIFLKKVLQKLKERLLEKFPDAEIILYGSNARGDYERSSDIDLLILVKHKINRRLKEEITEISYDLELQYDVVFGIIIENRDFWNSPLANAMPLHWNIDRDGVYV